MGIFNFGKKRNQETDNQKNKPKSNNSSLDLSNPVIKKMVDWIEHPMEFGKKPDSIEIVDQRVLFWPNNKNEQCYLLRFIVDGDTYIGFTGPTTWCFFGIDFSKLTFEQLYERYTGWFIAFFSSQSEQYEKNKEGLNEESFHDKLMRSGLSKLKTLQKVYLGGETYYEISAEEGGKKVKVVGTESNYQEVPSDHILPYFEFIGISWDPLAV